MLFWALVGFVVSVAWIVLLIVPFVLWDVFAQWNMNRRIRAMYREEKRRARH